MQNQIAKEIEIFLDHHVTNKRRVHTTGVVAEAIRLAERYKEDSEKAVLAARCHDMAREYTNEELNQFLVAYDLPERYRDAPDLSHGKIAAAMLQKEFGIQDKEVLNAVSFHTTGRKGMSLLEKIIYVADAIEPSRNYPGVEEIRRTADEDLDRACLMAMESTIRYVKDRGKQLDQDTEAAMAWIHTIITESRKDCL
ncbi:MAG: phosphohydrolase [Firmicutes bacterium HGW-Firmicutes-11]|jgi:predicted HD superfamily hydrolase involved in NAD metabolism|nr:MAG: phosphohydrolase [Firmicutes bacterium HGW-Firmicutes-11]